MQIKHHYSPTFRRELWGEGNWNDEPDEAFWLRDGFPCWIRRNPMGHLCGYAGVPQNHPYYMLTSGTVPLLSRHGLTFADFGQGIGFNVQLTHDEPRDDPEHPFKQVMPMFMPDYAGHWFFGFHCSEHWQYSPAMHSKDGYFGTVVQEVHAELLAQGINRGIPSMLGKPYRIASQCEEVDTIRDTVYMDFVFVRDSVEILADQLSNPKPEAIELMRKLDDDDAS